ncbi:hypothetical protein Tco_0424064 [Tanacetum coccineum]
MADGGGVGWHGGGGEDGSGDEVMEAAMVSVERKKVVRVSAVLTAVVALAVGAAAGKIGGEGGDVCVEARLK